MTQAQDVLAAYERRAKLSAQENWSEGDTWEEELYRLYFDLPLDEGRELAEAAFNLFETRSYLAEDILEALACFVDGALTDVHGRLLQRRADYFPYLFRAAGAVHAAPLIDKLNAFDRWSTTPHSINRELLILAWIGGKTVEQQFASWRDAPPEWQSPSFLSVSPADYAQEAGWEVTPDGGRRDLFFPISYRLVEVRDGARREGVDVMRMLGETCPACNHPLHAMFDLDLTLPDLAFLGGMGERLTLMTCTVCTLTSTVFTDFDWHGHAAWDHANNEPRNTAHDAPIPFPDLRLGLGPARRTPYEALADHGFFSASQIGGCPRWVQHAQFPRCPSCGMLMRYVGQTNIGDLIGPLPKGAYYPTEGNIYAFLCGSCQKAATRFQFS